VTDRPNILLDTCAMLFVANGTAVEDRAQREISEAAYDGRLYVSPMSAWEIGIGVAKNRLKLPLEPLDFFQRFLRVMKAQLSAVSPEILISSSNLPGRLHGDPMDRILISSARHLDMILVTRDQPILDYGSDGHLRTLAC
jgi:PIN domain nuclease of toxin-antitoxin system